MFHRLHHVYLCCHSFQLGANLIFMTLIDCICLAGFRLYIAKIGLGSPSKDFHVQVDTGSDVLWVNCAECSNCPTKNNLGVRLPPPLPSFFALLDDLHSTYRYCYCDTV